MPLLHCTPPHLPVLALFPRLYALDTGDELGEHGLVVHREGGSGQGGVLLRVAVLVPLQQVRHPLGGDLLGRPQEISTMAKVSPVKQQTEIQVICVLVLIHNDIKFTMYMLYYIQCILLKKVNELLY